MQLAVASGVSANLIREVKADYPNFEITISFAFSTLMPMKPIPEMDFLSGDVAALSDMRAVSRGFVHQGKPWDVMSWAAPDFAPGPDGGNVGIAQKNLTRLCRKRRRSFPRAAATKSSTT